MHGFALGGGFELALSCDLIVADRTAVVGLPEVSVGVIPGGGGTQLLPRRVGAARAAELIFTARRVEAAEARELGLVDRLVDEGRDRAEALALASRIAANSPVGLRAAKRALRLGHGLDLRAGLEVEDAAWRSVAFSGDRAEGVAAFNEKRQAGVAGGVADAGAADARSSISPVRLRNLPNLGAWVRRAGWRPWWRWRRAWPPRTARGRPGGPPPAGPAGALGGSFAALSVWERELGRLRVLVNVGELAAGEEEFPEDESYPVHQFPEITEFLHERWAGAASPTPGWRPPRAPRPGAGPGTAISGSRRCGGAGAAAVWSRRSCCTGGRGASCTWPGRPACPSSAGRTPTSRPCWPRWSPPGSRRPSGWRRPGGWPSRTR